MKIYLLEDRLEGNLARKIRNKSKATKAKPRPIFTLVKKSVKSIIFPPIYPQFLLPIQKVL